MKLQLIIIVFWVQFHMLILVNCTSNRSSQLQLGYNEYGNEGCPTWTYNYTSNGSTFCKCGYGSDSVITCDQSSLKVEISKCYCMTYSEKYEDEVMGICAYNCYLNTRDQKYYDVPKNTSLLNNATCGIYNRQGQMCSWCLEGYGVSVYSYEFYCAKCTEYEYNWLKYVVIAYLPLTLFYLVIVCFKISVVKSLLIAYVLVGQLTTTLQVAHLIDTRRLYFRGHSRLGRVVGIRIYFTICGIWNLDFGRSLYEPFCLHPHLSTHQVEVLNYCIAFYPLLLILITYILVKLHDNYRLVVFIWKPFYRCIRCFQKEWNIKSSIIDAFASFLFLSNAKLLNVSFDLISVPITLWTTNATRIPISYTYTNCSMEYLGREHVPYFVLGLVVILVFNVVPILLLCFYPFHWFQKCLRSCSLRSLSLHIFMDAFQGCYKTKPRDYRSLASLPLIITLLNFIVFYLTTNAFYFTILGYMLVLLSFVILVCRPYKKEHHNYINSFIYISISFVAFSYNRSVALIRSDHAYLQLLYSIIQSSHTILTAVPTLLIIFVLAARLVRTLREKVCHRLSTALTDSHREYLTREDDLLLPATSN